MSRRWPSRQTIALFLLLAFFMVAVLLLADSGVPARMYELDSSEPSGLLLLKEWLQEMGYSVATTDGRAFTIPAEADLFLVYPGAQSFSEEDAAKLAAWVHDGGALAIIGGDPVLAETFGYALEMPALPSFVGSARQVQPILPRGAQQWLGPGPGALSQAPADAAPVLVLSEGEGAVWVQTAGAGTLWWLAQGYAFTNADLMANEQPYLWLALLRTVPQGGTVVVDTYHLFGPDLLANGRNLTIQDWLYGTMTGWATLFLLILAAVYFVLSGRRLGPPLPVPAQDRRREAAEFVVAMAGLQRRARIQDSVARHHRHRLRQVLGRRYRIPADLSDADFLAQLRIHDPSLSEDRARQIERVLLQLAELPDEEKLIELVGEVDTLTARR